MKKIALLAVVLSVVVACEPQGIESELSTVAMIEAEKISDFTCINEQVDNAPALSEATDMIVGDWQLKAILTMLPSTDIPNIVLRIGKDLSVSVFKAGVIIHKDDLVITEESGRDYRILKLDSSRSDFAEGGYNFLYGGLRVCDNELFIDNGIAFDAPGYFFRKK